MLNLLNFRFNMEHGAYFIKVETDDFECDLHNFANFIHANYNVQNRELSLRWTIRQDHGVPQLPEPFNGLDLIFQEVDYLEMSQRDPEMPYSEDDALDTISYMTADSILKDYLHNDTIPALRPDTDRDRNTEYHTLFRFRGGQMIRVGAQSAKLTLMVF